MCRRHAAGRTAGDGVEEERASAPSACALELHHRGVEIGEVDDRDRVQAVIFAYESGLTRPGPKPAA